MGYQVTFIPVDEDKGLTQSSEFCTLVVQLNCVLETTGSGNSNNNGKVERQNRSKADMVLSALATGQNLFGSDLPSDMTIETFWCFAYQHACYTHCVLYNRLHKAFTYVLVGNVIPTVNHLEIWGSITTAIAPNKNSMPKLSQVHSSHINVLSFGNNTSNIEISVFSFPFCQSELPSDANICHTLLVLDYQPTDSIPNVYKFKVCDCTVGTNQVKGIDFPESYCAVINTTTLT